VKAIALYPAVQKVFREPDPTRTLARDHVEIGRYIKDSPARSNSALEASTPWHSLHGLYTIVRLRLPTAEAVCLPRLDERLAPEEAVQCWRFSKPRSAKRIRLL